MSHFETTITEVFFNPNEPGEKLQPILDVVVNRFRYVNDENRREDFRSALQSFVRLYGYISQIIEQADEDLEKLCVFAGSLIRKLPKRELRLPFEVQDTVDLDSFRIQKTFDEIKISLEKEDGPAPGITTETRKTIEEEKDFLSNIIQTLIDAYGVDLTGDDKMDMAWMHEKTDENPELRAVMNPKKSREYIRIKFDQIVDEILLEFVDK